MHRVVIVTVGLQLTVKMMGEAKADFSSLTVTNLFLHQKKKSHAYYFTVVLCTWPLFVPNGIVIVSIWYLSIVLQKFLGGRITFIAVKYL